MHLNPNLSTKNAFGMSFLSWLMTSFLVSTDASVNEFSLLMHNARISRSDKQRAFQIDYAFLARRSSKCLSISEAHVNFKSLNLRWQDE